MEEEMIVDGNTQQAEVQEPVSEASFDTNSQEQYSDIPEQSTDDTTVTPSEEEEKAQKNISTTVPKDIYLEERRLRQENEAKLREYEEQLRNNAQKFQQYPKTPEEIQIEKDEAEARKVLEKLGFAPKDEIDKLVQEKLSAIEKAQIEKEQAAESRRQLDASAYRMGKKYPGNNGFPKFDYDKVTEYGLKNGIYNLEAAYQSMHFSQLASKLGTPNTKPLQSPAQGNSGAGSEINTDSLTAAQLKALIDAKNGR